MQSPASPHGTSCAGPRNEDYFHAAWLRIAKCRQNSAHSNGGSVCVDSCRINFFVFLFP
jgi:hypothetical protein